MSNAGDVEELLLAEDAISVYENEEERVARSYRNIARKVWIESRKLWNVVGPAICGRVTSTSMVIITQACAGHLGDLQLGAISVATNVIVGLDIGLLLGMASALETVGGQAFGAKKYYMLGVYLQRSWLVLLLACVILMPLYLFATPLLKILGYSSELAELSGVASIWMIPLHFSFAFQMPLQRFLQSQMRNKVVALSGVIALIFHAILSFLLVQKLNLGMVGATITLDLSWWVIVFVQFGYAVGGGCPLTWSGFSWDAFSNLWDYTKLSLSSGIMLCLENWYYRILILMIGTLKDAEIALDALSICMSINGWEMAIPLAFFAGIGVRVSNELGAGNGEGAKFAMKVAVWQSIVIGSAFFVLIIAFPDKLGWIFSSSEPVAEAVGSLSTLLAFSVMLNSVQPVLSGVAVGSGWQHLVAYVNLCCYYLFGIPLGIILGWGFNFGVKGIWGGMIFGGTAIQTLMLAIITARCDWEKEAETAVQHVHKWENEEDDEKVG